MAECVPIGASAWKIHRENPPHVILCKPWAVSLKCNIQCKMATASFESCLTYAVSKTGFEYELKLKQEEALKSVYEGRDTLVVLPTGYGKSLIYQLLPFILSKKRNLDRDGIVIIVSPLNALMQDQVRSLRGRGVHACFLNVEGGGGNTNKLTVHREGDDEDDEETERSETIFSSVSLDEIKTGNFHLLYAHPETLIEKKEIGKILRSIVYKKHVCCTVVDEVHMVTEWGAEFRKSFAKLGHLTALFTDIPHLALTATATEESLKALSKVLDFKNTNYIVENPDRPNIFIDIRTRQPNVRKYEKYDGLLTPICEELKGKMLDFPLTIVYCDSLESVGYSYMFTQQYMGDQAYVGNDQIPENRIFAQYHKEYTPKMKSHIISQLTKENPVIRLVYATVALGMGLNAPSILRIVHFRPPTTLENYMQEIGRAGRTGKYAEAIMFYNNSDIATNRPGLDKAVREFSQNKTSCLRKHLLKYFGFDSTVFTGPKELCCCNCKKTQ